MAGRAFVRLAGRAPPTPPRRPAAHPPELLADLEASHVRHHAVHEHQVWQHLQGFRESRPSVQQLLATASPPPAAPHLACFQVLQQLLATVQLLDLVTRLAEQGPDHLQGWKECSCFRPGAQSRQGKQQHSTARSSSWRAASLWQISHHHLQVDHVVIHRQDLVGTKHSDVAGAQVVLLLPRLLLLLLLHIARAPWHAPAV